jgi:hypothetical protein
MTPALSLTKRRVTKTELERILGGRGAMISGVVLAAALTITAGGSPQEQKQGQLKFREISTLRIEHMIDVGGRKLHCCVYGNGSPTVVLVGGLEAPQAYWNSVIPGLAAKTTVVTYDRAGTRPRSLIE